MTSRRTFGAAEIRAASDGPHLYGVMIQEGRAASGGRREVFTPGSVEWPSGGVGILTDHRQAPEVRALPVRQSDGRITVRTPATPAIREAVEAGRRFMSVEFHSLAERTTKGGVREVLRAFVPDAALVTEPEYDTTAAEVRARLGGFSFSSTVRTKRVMDCRCAGTAGEDVRAVEFSEDAFEGVEKLDVAAVTRGQDSVISSTTSGTLTLENTSAGLAISMELLDVEPARNLRSLVESGEAIYARPLWDPKRSDWTATGETALVTSAWFTTILVRPVPGFNSGLDPVELVNEERRTRRRRLWL